MFWRVGLNIKSGVTMPESLLQALKLSLPHKLAVAWSGGADSTALLMMLHLAGFEVEAWHVDHAWHAASSEVAEQLKLQAAAWHIPFECRRLAAPGTANREAIARAGRYQALQDIARDRGLFDLALAQHQGDQAETVCMRLLQGAGVSGCRGIARQRQHDGLMLYRPLLQMPKSELVDFLKSSNIGWVEDASNRDQRLKRNRVRLSLFPAMLNGGFDPVMLFCRWGEQALKLSEEITLHLEALNFESQSGHCSVCWETWRKQPQAVRAAALQLMASSAMGEGVVLGRRHIELVEVWIHKSARGSVDLSRCTLSREGRGLHLRSV